MKEKKKYVEIVCNFLSNTVGKIEDYEIKELLNILDHDNDYTDINVDKERLYYYNLYVKNDDYGMLYEELLNYIVELKEEVQ